MRGNNVIKRLESIRNEIKLFRVHLGASKLIYNNNIICYIFGHMTYEIP